MSHSISLRSWLRMVLVLAACSLAGCQRDATTAKVEPITWDSEEVREVEQQWKVLDDAYSNSPDNQDKSKYGELQKQFDALFAKRLSEQELGQLSRSKQIPDRAAVNRLIEFMARTFIASGDRESLTALLSTQCPFTIAWNNTIEFHLAFHGQRLTHPILVLGEAYSKCEDPSTRRRLAAAVRRAFADQGISGKDDDDYVKNAMQWYQKEADSLKVNGNYWRNEWAVPAMLLDEQPKSYARFYEGTPTRLKREVLFKRKGFSEGEGPAPSAQCCRRE